MGRPGEDLNWGRSLANYFGRFGVAGQLELVQRTLQVKRFTPTGLMTSFWSNCGGLWCPELASEFPDSRPRLALGKQTNPLPQIRICVFIRNHARQSCTTENSRTFNQKWCSEAGMASNHRAPVRDTRSIVCALQDARIGLWVWTCRAITSTSHPNGNDNSAIRP
jgi:hypothetical protein